MPKPKSHTLQSLAKVSGVSRKTVQAAFAAPGAPARTRPIEELVEYIRRCATGAVELPADYVERAQLAKLTALEKRAGLLAEQAEKERLLVKKLKSEVRDVADILAEAEGVGAMLAAKILAQAKEAPVKYAMKSHAEIATVSMQQAQALIRELKENLTKLSKK
jgi:hypothetical protein